MNKVTLLCLALIGLIVLPASAQWKAKKHDSEDQLETRLKSTPIRLQASIDMSTNAVVTVGTPSTSGRQFIVTQVFVETTSVGTFTNQPTFNVGYGSAAGTNAFVAAASFVTNSTAGTYNPATVKANAVLLPADTAITFTPVTTSGTITGQGIVHIIGVLK